MDEQASTSVIAFFDVDNTLIHGASVFHLVRGLRAAGLITVRDIVGAVWKQARFKVRGENDRHLASARVRGLEVLTGVAVADMAEYDGFYKRLIAVASMKNVTSRFAMERLKHTTAYPLHPRAFRDRRATDSGTGDEE